MVKFTRICQRLLRPHNLFICASLALPLAYLFTRAKEDLNWLLAQHSVCHANPAPGISYVLNMQANDDERIIRGQVFTPWYSHEFTTNLYYGTEEFEAIQALDCHKLPDYYMGPNHVNHQPHLYERERIVGLLTSLKSEEPGSLKDAAKAVFKEIGTNHSDALLTNMARGYGTTNVGLYWNLAVFYANVDHLFRQYYRPWQEDNMPNADEIELLESGLSYINETLSDAAQRLYPKARNMPAVVPFMAMFSIIFVVVIFTQCVIVYVSKTRKTFN